ncbi:minor tail protein [Streptomyces phage Sebastisaurus]|uniref:Minor tail protein n=1 Tax=Streptomyces phage Sebastisaurus TaxID=2510572 RepID=A0A411B3R6_9CAUD|nr:minor tail protein [Streptomyces phage Sebastisaurus]
MAGFAWFQEGVTYGGNDLANFNSLSVPRLGMTHLFASTSEFLLNSDQTARTVSVGAGNVLIGLSAGGATWAWSDTATVAVPTASSVNPRRDLIVARLTTAAADGVNGIAVELIQGTPAATPVAPTRPANAVALGWVDVPKSMTTFTITVTRYQGQYRDQAALAGRGAIAIDWAGQLPSASSVSTGATVYDVGTNQRWTRKSDSTWFTTDPGPWKACTPQNVQAKDGTNVTVTGTLYVREDSTKWELSGQLTFSPSKDLDQLVTPALAPSGVTRPTQNTYGSSGQTYGSTSAGGVARLALMANGSIEYGCDGVVGNAYINESFSKSPWNTA